MPQVSPTRCNHPHHSQDVGVKGKRHDGLEGSTADQGRQSGAEDLLGVVVSQVGHDALDDRVRTVFELLTDYPDCVCFACRGGDVA